MALLLIGFIVPTLQMRLREGTKSLVESDSALPLDLEHQWPQLGEDLLLLPPLPPFFLFPLPYWGGETCDQLYV